MTLGTRGWFGRPRFTKRVQVRSALQGLSGFAKPAGELEILSFAWKKDPLFTATNVLPSPRCWL